MAIDGVRANVGDRVERTSVVTVDGVRLPIDPEMTTWLVYKPPGVVSTMEDPQGRPTVVDLVPSEPVTKPVGRLDLHSEGLLLMTNDGDLALAVTHPRYGIEKTYSVLVSSRVTEDEVRMLRTGVELDDGRARPVRVNVAASHGDRTLVDIVMTEGRKREVRRMFEAIGLSVDRLIRTSIGSVSDRSLRPGEYRALTLDETRGLFEAAGFDRADQPGDETGA